MYSNVELWRLFSDSSSHVWDVSLTSYNRADNHKGLIPNGPPQPLQSSFEFLLTGNVMLHGLSGSCPLWSPQSTLSEMVDRGIISAKWESSLAPFWIKVKDVKSTKCPIWGGEIFPYNPGLSSSVVGVVRFGFWKFMFESCAFFCLILNYFWLEIELNYFKIKLLDVSQAKSVFVSKSGKCVSRSCALSHVIYCSMTSTGWCFSVHSDANSRFCSLTHHKMFLSCPLQWYDSLVA